MNKPQQSSKNIKKTEELKTEGPISEKDEVKAAEAKLAKKNKTATRIANEKKK